MSEIPDGSKETSSKQRQTHQSIKFGRKSKGYFLTFPAFLRRRNFTSWRT